ncbi:luciferase-like domain-containing protein [Lophiotrema nucula]|uniref:Luciferase-like domain-containing protein n=1 Tax=Lophiotrema nucula TaxID=690887 RepID=A0A6A5ZAB1_9PLEO|nr:luciferase-like domain-containing protein [Lophiotrema nucula]
MANTTVNATYSASNGTGSKKQILLNAFDMSTVGHLSPSQWNASISSSCSPYISNPSQNPKDRSFSKRDLQYWVDLAKLLEREKSMRCSLPTHIAATIHIKDLSTTPFRLEYRHELEEGAFNAIKLDSPIEHDKRYAQADEYLRVLYKLWEGSWAPDAISPKSDEDEYADPDKIRTIHHKGKYFTLDSRHIVDPSPQRTPLLFQAGTSPAGSEFAATLRVFTLTLRLRPKIRKDQTACSRQGPRPTFIEVLRNIHAHHWRH